MFNIGTQELLVILLIALLLFGARRIPEVARSFGKGLHDFREAMSGFEREIREEALGEKSVTPRLQPPRQAPVARGDAAGPSRPASQVAEQADGAGAASPRPENPAGQDPA
ncbi:MAG: twin-arginine translocase TatA/TatE family subunit [Candidatus Eisenbacteria bacterium]|nr:twin-arginine translocase TatA/TatE family subunit [Candidatus Eisenbacteria bacterium]